MEKNSLVYHLEDKLSLPITFMSAVQWVIFIIINNIVIPIVIGNVFKLSPQETAELVQRTLLLAGATSLLQIFVGHRLPVFEGVASLWWSIFIVMAQNAVAAGIEPRLILPALEGGVIASGIALIVLGLTPLHKMIEKLFTPMITGSYIILLSMQMSMNFFGKMLGTETGGLDIKYSIVSVIVMAVMLILSYKGKGAVKSLSALIGIVIGWIVSILIGIENVAQPAAHTGSILSIPKIFAWGYPQFDPGIIITSILTAVVLLSNLFASMHVLNEIEPGSVNPSTGRGGIIFNGIGDILAGLFSNVGTSEYSVSVGFIQATGNAAKIPFIAASVFVFSIGFFNPIGRFFTTMPIVVGYAVSIVILVGMLGVGIRTIERVGLSERNMLILGVGFCTGAGIMAMPSQVFLAVPALFRNILSNGMLMGTIVILIMEHLIFKKHSEQTHELQA